MRNFLIGVAIVISSSAVASADPQYAAPRTMEAGVSAGVSIATDSRDFNVTPSIGFFLHDNLELSGILSLSRVHTEMDTSFVGTALVEPSYHVPIVARVHGFFGVGIGGSWVQSVGPGFAVAPRLGTNVVVGRSGVITPSVSWQYSTQGAASAMRVNVGYSMMW